MRIPQIGDMVILYMRGIGDVWHNGEEITVEVPIGEVWKITRIHNLSRQKMSYTLEHNSGVVQVVDFSDATALDSYPFEFLIQRFNYFSWPLSETEARCRQEIHRAAYNYGSDAIHRELVMRYGDIASRSASLINSATRRLEEIFDGALTA